MDSLGQIERLFAHDAWANRQTLAALRATASPQPQATRLFAHGLATEFLWLARIRQEPSPLPVWPELTLEGCELRLQEVETAWADYLEDLDAEGLVHAVAYTNSQGQRWTSTVEEILTHVCLHGHYHRGQVASALRSGGEAPPVTDFAFGTRTGSF